MNAHIGNEQWNMNKGQSVVCMYVCTRNGENLKIFLIDHRASLTGWNRLTDQINVKRKIYVLFEITAISSRASHLLFRISAHLYPALLPAHTPTHTLPRPRPSTHVTFLKSSLERVESKWLHSLEMVWVQGDSIENTGLI